MGTSVRGHVSFPDLTVSCRVWRSQAAGVRASMATAVPRKKRHLEEDRDEGHASKRSKDSKDSKKHSKKKRRREKEGSHKLGSLRVRSASELAKLVSTGAIRLPKSLMHYVDDRAQLLDQVFTILSHSDIRGMLPDTLKELKMKRVKQLCYEQLRQLSTEELCDAINPEESGSITDRQLNSVLNELLSQQETVEERAEEGDDRGGNRESKLPPEEEIVTSSSPAVEGEERPLSSSPVEVADREVLESSMDEIVIHVSDVSGDEQEKAKRKRKLKRPTLRPDPDLSRGGRNEEQRQSYVQPDPSALESDHSRAASSGVSKQQQQSGVIPDPNSTVSRGGSDAGTKEQRQVGMSQAGPAFKQSRTCRHSEHSPITSNQTEPHPPRLQSEGVQSKEGPSIIPSPEKEIVSSCDPAASKAMGAQANPTPASQVMEEGVKTEGLESEGRVRPAQLQQKATAVRSRGITRKLTRVSGKAGAVSVVQLPSKLQANTESSDSGGDKATTLLEWKLRERVLKSLLAKRKKKLITSGRKLMNSSSL